MVVVVEGELDAAHQDEFEDAAIHVEADGDASTLHPL
jgi:hypothetical protein